MNLTSERIQVGWQRVAFFISLLGAVTVTQAVEPEQPGKTLYVKYCSACHGEGGKGDGIVSGFLRPKPSDLTQLAKKSGGTFPFVPTMQAIDGTVMVRAHGESAMPVWGESFRRESTGPADGQVRARGQLMLITEYVESIQEK